MKQPIRSTSPGTFRVVRARAQVVQKECEGGKYRWQYPMPYNFGPGEDTEHDKVRETLLEYGRMGPNECAYKKISVDTMKSVISKMNRDGWRIEFKKTPKSFFYKLVEAKK